MSKKENIVEVPKYVWVDGKPDPDKYGSTGGCYGCAFRTMLEIKCSLIPCQTKPGKVVKLINENTST